MALLLVTATASDLCRSECQRFEPQFVRDFYQYHLSYTKFISLFNYSIPDDH